MSDSPSPAARPDSPQATAGPGSRSAAAQPDTPANGAVGAKTSYLAIYVLLAAAFIAILNETIMSVAIPVIKDDLAITAGLAQWVTTGFLLTMAVVIPVTGFLIAKMSLRQLFAVSQGLFVAGTLIGAMAPGFTVVIIGRVIQAAGTAVLLPLLMTTVLRLVPERNRGTMMGNMSIVIAVAPAIGPTVSGFILRLAENNWHMLFWTMLPIGALVLAGGLFLLPNDGDRSDKRIDVLSVALSALGFGARSTLSLVGIDHGPKLWIPLPSAWRRYSSSACARSAWPAMTGHCSISGCSHETSPLRRDSLGGHAGDVRRHHHLPLYLALRDVPVLTIGLILMPPAGDGPHGPVRRPRVRQGLAAPAGSRGRAGRWASGRPSSAWRRRCGEIVASIVLRRPRPPVHTAVQLGLPPAELYPPDPLWSIPCSRSSAVGTAMFVAVAAPSPRHGHRGRPDRGPGHRRLPLLPVGGRGAGVGITILSFQVKATARKVTLQRLISSGRGTPSSRPRGMPSATPAAGRAGRRLRAVAPTVPRVMPRWRGGRPCGPAPGRCQRSGACRKASPSMRASEEGRSRGSGS